MRPLSLQTLMNLERIPQVMWGKMALQPLTLQKVQVVQLEQILLWVEGATAMQVRMVAQIVVRTVVRKRMWWEQ